MQAFNHGVTCTRHTQQSCVFDSVHAMFSMKTALLHLHCSEPLVWEPLHPNYASSKGHVDCSWLHITYVQQIRVNAVCFETLPFFVSYASGSPAVCMMLPKTACLAPSVNSSLCNRHMGAFIHSYACPFPVSLLLSCCPPPCPGDPSHFLGDPSCLPGDPASFPGDPSPFPGQQNHSHLLLHLSNINKQHLGLLCRATTVMCWCT